MFYFFYLFFFFFSSRRRHTRFDCDWSSDVCSSDLEAQHAAPRGRTGCGRARPRGRVLSPAFSRERNGPRAARASRQRADRKSTRLNSSHSQISYAVFCLKKKKKNRIYTIVQLY